MRYFSYSNELKPRCGDLLVSEPMLPDVNFERSVVLLTDHSEKGSIGFVLNKPTIFQLSDVVKVQLEQETSIFVGGPVEQNTLHFLHTKAFPLVDSQEVTEGVFWGADFDQALALIEQDPKLLRHVKFFVGYSGWSNGQLEQELQENSWIVYRGAKSEDIFELPSQELWKSILLKMGGKYKVYANYPIDPRLN
ncbi:MAG: YqgE/AlgH family protein [Cytophagales bacterium]|nr:YqgE/AlgH family protein [Cytophagales bacterium]